MADDPHSAERGFRTADPAGTAPLRVLVVEEDRVEGGMLAFHLRREELIVMLMASEDEVLDAMAWAPPDAILVEARGRELDGLALVRGLSNAPIGVFLMADGPLGLEEDLEALRLGVADVFTKPLDPAVVAKRIRGRPRLASRGSLPDLPDGGISGHLAAHGVMYLLQLCHRHRMNARLHVELDGDWGVMLIRHGEVIDAESPGATGREAVFDALRKAEGAFVLFPLGLDADELSRDDVVRADLATLFTEAVGRPEPRPVNAALWGIEPEPPLAHQESPRGPLSRRHQRPRESLNETLEYRAAPASLNEVDTLRPRPVIRKQVGVPLPQVRGQGASTSRNTHEGPAALQAKQPAATPSGDEDAQSLRRPPAVADHADGLVSPGARRDDEASGGDAALSEAQGEGDHGATAGRAPAPEPDPTPGPPRGDRLAEDAIATMPSQAAVVVERPRDDPGATLRDGEPLTADRHENTSRRRVSTGAQIRERAGKVRRPTRPMPVSTPAPDSLEPARPLAEETPAPRGENPRRQVDTAPQGNEPMTPPSARIVRPGTARPASARVVRPGSGHSDETLLNATAARPPESGAGGAPAARSEAPSKPPPEPPVDEPTDIQAQSPVAAGPRVRRPTTGMFRFGDPAAPREVTDVEIDPADVFDDTLLGEPVRRRRLHPGVLALAVVFVAVLVFVVARLASAPSAPPEEAPQVAALSPEERLAARFGEAAASAERGETGAAQRALRSLWDEGYREPHVVAGLARTYLERDQLDLAKQALSALAEAAPDDPKVHAYLGLVLSTRGDEVGARAALTRARGLASPGPLAERLDHLLELSAPEPD